MAARGAAPNGSAPIRTPPGSTATGRGARTTDAGFDLHAGGTLVRRQLLATGAGLRRGLGVRASVGSTAPFVGLVGTVLGVIDAFGQIGGGGAGGLVRVSSGIAEALVTTAIGIGVAIPAVWLFNALSQRIGRLLVEYRVSRPGRRRHVAAGSALMAPVDAGDELRSEINVTPLVDVMLVLLVIFMVVTPMLRLELPIEVPSATTAREVASTGQRLTISVAADGAPVTRADLGAALAAALAGRADGAVFLEADRATAYAAVVEVMDAARAAGISRLGVVTGATGGRR